MSRKLDKIIELLDKINSKLDKEVKNRVKPIKPTTIIKGK